GEDGVMLRGSSALSVALKGPIGKVVGNGRDEHL
ncbi:MAG: hypothetical protein ACJAXQ_001493, partial [Parvibaculaceae bacterium]